MRAAVSVSVKIASRTIIATGQVAANTTTDGKVDHRNVSVARWITVGISSANPSFAHLMKLARYGYPRMEPITKPLTIAQYHRSRSPLIRCPAFTSFQKTLGIHP